MQFDSDQEAYAPEPESWEQLAEDDEDFEDGGYGEGFDPDEAFGETEYLSEDDFDDRMDDNEPEDGE